MWKALAILVAILNTIYAAAVYNGHEPTTASVITDQFLISALLLFVVFARD